ncbi:hypothetical protein PanWU01x14_016990, partial [Parasponia andersonii]
KMRNWSLKVKIEQKWEIFEAICSFTQRGHMAVGVWGHLELNNSKRLCGYASVVTRPCKPKSQSNYSPEYVALVQQELRSHSDP